MFTKKIKCLYTLHNLNKIQNVIEGERYMENLSANIWTDEEDDVSKARLSVLIYATCLVACELDYRPGNGYQPYGVSDALDAYCVGC